MAEAERAGELLAASDLRPRIAHTSVLTRAIQTANSTLDAAALAWLPVRRSWRLNERHYGALQGKDKAQTRADLRRRAIHGVAQVLRHPAAAHRG